ncbi:pectate lyase C [Coprinopsis cinerea okayama7|uniref:Pectate lyase n=1 Tax=Coprinopsis cinerea (strain Okayama-7 / 130 / ATCC MYA-4618 / FGSC 9003) TaxID=240176 RepID=A8NTC2_COPC7|nr:pectate lyase C [Coprinopsis cinerea okayama7\|eukprot:XP_001836193.2 pectate lyase C [Coprinopsis cinerea okayama7\
MFTVLALTTYFLGALANPIEKRAATNVFPNPPSTSSLSAPIRIRAGTTFTPPVAYTRYDRGWGACQEQKEGGQADAVFLLEEGATLRNVVIGPHQMEGSCRLENVFFEDVCEDAVTIKQNGGTSYIVGGGAKHATDKIIQHNGGGRVIIDSFFADGFGTFYRSCGNCRTQHARHVEVLNSWAINGNNLIGVNSNYGDTATIRQTRVSNVRNVCQRYIVFHPFSGDEAC